MVPVVVATSHQAVVEVPVAEEMVVAAPPTQHRQKCRRDKIRSGDDTRSSVPSGETAADPVGGTLARKFSNHT